MSAISQKSISGITSITTPASVENQFTIHTNNTTEAFKLDHAGNIHIHNHVKLLVYLQHLILKQEQVIYIAQD